MIKYHAEKNCVFATHGDRKWLHSKHLQASVAEEVAHDCNANPPSNGIVEYFVDGNSVFGCDENGREFWIMRCEAIEKAEEFASVLNARLCS